MNRSAEQKIKAMKVPKPYPNWICRKCGQKWGSHKGGCSTWHDGTCGVCGAYNTPVTEPRDYGYPDFIGHSKAIRSLEI